jgi:RNA polymerase sigma factor (sigma-70 family)
MPRSPVQLLRQIRHVSEAPDADLLGRFVARHDETAFAALVGRHGPMVLRVCHRILADTHAAEDAFQATFLVLAKRAGALRRPDALAAWLHGVACRVALKTRCARPTSRPLPEDSPDPRPDPLAEVSVRELLAVLDEEVTRLPQAYRLPVLLCCLEGLSQEEAAHRLGWTPGSVKGRLERGRKKLHARLTRRGLTLPAALAAVEVSRAVLSAELAQRAVTAARAKLRPVPVPSVPRMRTVAGLVLAAAVIAAGVGSWLSAGGREPVTAKPASGVRPTADEQRDPLPAGALVRMGTTRLRHHRPVSELAFSPDDKTLLSGSLDGTLRVWDAATGRQLSLIHPQAHTHYSVTFSRDGKPLAAGGIEKTVVLWDIATGKVLRRFAGHQDAVLSVFLAADGSRLASVERGRTRLWSADGKGLLSLRQGTYPDRAVAFSPDGRTLATSSLFEEVRLWDMGNGRLLRKLAGKEVQGGLIQRWASALAFSPDGKTLAVACENQTVRLWDVATGKQTAELTGGGLTVAFSRDGKVLASGDWDGAVVVWDVGTRKELRRIPGHQGAVSAIAISPDGKTLASGGGGMASERIHHRDHQLDNLIRLWEVSTGKALPPTRDPIAAAVTVAFSPDGRLVASAGKDKIVRLWQAATGQPLRRLPGHQGTVYVVAFSPDGKLLASGSKDQTIRLWDVATGKGIRTLTGHKGGVESLAFSPDGTRLASAGSWDRTARLWDVATGKELRQLLGHAHGVVAVAFSPDGRKLATGGGFATLLPPPEDPNEVRIWDVDTGAELLRFKGPRNDFAVFALAFTPDGRTLISGCRNGPLRAWEVTTGKQRMEIDGRGDGALAISPDGKVLVWATPNYADSVHICDTKTGKERRQFVSSQGGVYAVVFSRDGKRLASAGEDGTVLIWDVARLLRP